MSKRKLPVLAEHSLSMVSSARVEIPYEFEHRVRGELSDQKRAISCRPGCSNCCYHPVHLSALEGVLLYRHLVSRGKWTPTFRAKIQEHADKTRDLSYEVWLLSLIPCPLLDLSTNRCTAYAGRPFQCRVTFSSGDPHNCHPHRISESEIINKHEVSREFHERVSRAIRRHGITMIIMPLSVAIFLGESISNGEIDLESADIAVLKDYLEST